MATNMNSGETEHLSLSKLFEIGYRIHSSLEKHSEPTNSVTFQSDVKKAIDIFEDTTRKISALDLFSTNEEIIEVATNDIKYLLLPALLGSLTLRLNTESRAEVLRIAEIYLKDFLARVKNYGVVNVDEEADKSNGHIPDLLEMTRQREDKIKKYKEMKEMEAKISDMKDVVESSTIDDEVKRDYYLTLVKRWTQRALDDLTAIQMEKPLIDRMTKAEQESRKGDEEIDRPKPKPLKPIIITKNEIQKKVYGLGYPSIPTMTVDEFYEQKVKDGTFSVPDISLQAQALGDFDRISRREQDDIEQEKGIEMEDPDTINRMRGWDDWKDDNRRGCGNRKNMG